MAVAFFQGLVAVRDCGVQREQTLVRAGQGQHQGRNPVGLGLFGKGLGIRV